MSDDSVLIQNICPDLVYRVRQRKSLPRATDRLRLLQQIFNKGIYSLEDLEILDRCNFHPEWDKQDLDVVLLDDNAWADKYWAPEFICSIFPTQKLFHTVLLDVKMICFCNMTKYNGLQWHVFVFMSGH